MFRPPGLEDVVPEGGHLEQLTLTLDEQYHDTAGCDLIEAGATLRSSTVDGHPIWQFLLAGGTDPIDVTIAPTAGTTVRTADSTTDSTGAVPEQLLALTTGLRRGAALRLLATVRTHRDVRRVLDRRDRLVVQVTDDQVHSAAPTPDGALLQEWRALHVEFGPGAKGRTASRVHRLLTGAGGLQVTAGNVVARALDRPDTSMTPASDTAGSVASAYLRDQEDALNAGDLTLRRGLGGIHPTRVATRRMRSTLRVYGKLFDPAEVTALDAELSWYASALGEVRDREVQRERMRKLVAAVPDELVLGPVAARIEQQLVAEQAERQRELDDAMNSERYFALLRECRRFVTAPPFTPVADRPAASLRRLVRRAERTLDKHLAAGLRRGGTDEELHKARKAGKRARYAVELATPVLGKKKARRVASAYQELQDTLGDFQDGVVSCELLRRLGAATADQPGENGFTYGLLYAQQLDRAARSRRAAARLRARL